MFLIKKVTGVLRNQNSLLLDKKGKAFKLSLPRVLVASLSFFNADTEIFLCLFDMHTLFNVL